MDRHIDSGESHPAPLHTPAEPFPIARANGAQLPVERRGFIRSRPDCILYVEFAAGNGGIVLDISETGAGLQMAAPLQSPGGISFRFQVPAIGKLEISAATVWLDATHKHCGIQFIDLPAKALEEIRRWMQGGGPAYLSRREKPVPRRSLAAIPVDSVPPYRPVRDRQTTAISGASSKPIFLSPVASTSGITVPEQSVLSVPTDRLDAVVPNHVAPADSPLPTETEPKAAVPSPKRSIGVPPRAPVALPANAIPALSSRQANSTSLQGGVEWTIRPVEVPQPAKKVAVKPLPQIPISVGNRWLICLAAVAVLFVCFCGIPIGHAIAQLHNSISTGYRTAAPESSVARSAISGTRGGPLEASVGGSSLWAAPSATAPPHTPAGNSVAYTGKVDLGLSLPATASASANSVSSAPSPAQAAAAAGVPPGQSELDLARQYLQDSKSRGAKAAAADLLWKAVKKGNADAEIELADLYGRGDGLERDCQQARSLLDMVRQKHEPYLNGKATAELDFIQCNGNN